MISKPTPTAAGLEAGVTLIELFIALTILVVVLMGVMSSIDRESAGLRSLAKMTAIETRAQEMINRLEQELLFAQGTSPSTAIVVNLGPTVTTELRVASTLGFPDQGTLLVNRGTPFEERLTYAGFDPVANSFVTLTRGQQCTGAFNHLSGDTVWWAGLAEPIEDQIAPPPSQWDGQAMEITGPVFFRGDGSGFSFRLPTDPAGGTDYFADGELQWGALVDGQPMLEGWSVLYFEPVTTTTEAEQRKDFNQDGDRDDTFEIGRIRMRSWDTTNPNRTPVDTALCPPMVLQEQCNWGGDLDNDGFEDPIFLWDPGSRSLHIRLLILGGIINRVPVIRRVESLIYLRNAS